MVDLSLTKLSVLLRVAEAYASDNISGISETATRLYPSGRYPFVLSTEYPLPLHLFSPRLNSMLTKDDDTLEAVGMWNLITARENIIRMISATELERTAAESLGKQFEVRYPREATEQVMKRKQMIGYMIKVVMECFGYTVYSSRMQVSTLRVDADPEKRKSNYFTTASRYAPFNTKDVKVLGEQITDEKTRTVFKSITNLIIKRQTDYHKLYNIGGLNYWDTL